MIRWLILVGGLLLPALAPAESVRATITMQSKQQITVDLLGRESDGMILTREPGKTTEIGIAPRDIVAVDFGLGPQLNTIDELTAKQEYQGAAVAFGALLKPLLPYSDLPGDVPRYTSTALRLYTRAGLWDDTVTLSYFISKYCRDEMIRREAQAYRAAALAELGRYNTVVLELKSLSGITRKDEICGPYFYALGKWQIVQTNWVAAQQTAATLVTARPRDLEWMPAGLYLSAQCYANDGKLAVAKQILTEIRTAYPASRWVALADKFEKELEQPKRKE